MSWYFSQIYPDFVPYGEDDNADETVMYESIGLGYLRIESTVVSSIAGN